MAAALPAQQIAGFQDRVPGVHGRGQKPVAHRRETLHGEVGRSIGALAAEADTLNSQLTDDVVAVAVFGGPVHRQARETDGCHVHHARVNDAVPADAGLLGQIVMERAEAGQILGHEAILSADGIAPPQAVAPSQRVIDSDRALVRRVMRNARVGVVIAVHAGAYDRGLSHHRHSLAAVHPHVHIGARTYF